MSTRPHHPQLFPLADWIEEALASEDEVNDTRVIAKRPPRDSYTHDQPILSASTLALAERFARLSDIQELCPLLESENENDGEALH